MLKVYSVKRAALSKSNAAAIIAMDSLNARILMIILFSIAGFSAQDIRETSQLRRNLRNLIEAKLDQNGDSDVHSSLVRYYVKTLRELNFVKFRKNIYTKNTTNHRLTPPQCSNVGICWR